MNPELLATASIAAAVAWGAGLRLYAVAFALGALHRLDVLPLPPSLEMLAHPLVMGIADKSDKRGRYPLLLWCCVSTCNHLPADA